MSLIVGIRAAQGLVLATDSMTRRDDATVFAARQQHAEITHRHHNLCWPVATIASSRLRCLVAAAFTWCCSRSWFKWQRWQRAARLLRSPLAVS